jgi:hypothetical protein
MRAESAPAPDQTRPTRSNARLSEPNHLVEIVVIHPVCWRLV